MNEEGKFWFGLWSLGAAVIVCVAGCITAYNITAQVNLTNNVRLMMVAGRNPVEVNCAIFGGTGGIDCNLLGRK